jgi:hypothetical protein
MTDVIRIRRRASGATGAPGALFASELAYNEVDDTLWYGKGNSGGNATAIVKAGGIGNFLPLTGGTITGALTFNVAYASGPGQASHINLISGGYIGFNTTDGNNINYWAWTSPHNFYVQQNLIAAIDGSGIHLSNDPPSAMYAVTKQYSDRNKSMATLNVSTSRTLSVDESDHALLYLYAQTAATTVTMPVATTVRTLWDISNVSNYSTTIAGISGGTITIQPQGRQAVWTDGAGIYPLNVTSPTPAANSNDDTVATTAFVHNYLPLVGGIVSGKLTVQNGLDTNSNVASSPQDTSGAITLWNGGANNTYGFCVTNSTLNYNAAGTLTNHDFYNGGTLDFRITQGNVISYGDLNVQNMLTVTNGIYVPAFMAAARRTSQGTYIGWNVGNGDGATWIMNNRGGGSGGFFFQQLNTDGTTGNRLLQVDGSGNVQSFGSLQTNSVSQGCSGLYSGGANNTGYIGFYNPAGQRCGYIGYGATNVMNMQLENGYTSWRMEGSLSVDNQLNVNMPGGSIATPATGAGIAINSTGDAVIAFDVQSVVATHMGMRQDGMFEIGGWSWQRNRFNLDSNGTGTFSGNIIAGTNFVSNNAYYMQAGNSAQQNSIAQIRFGYASTSQYAHWIATRHFGGSTSIFNAIDFYTCDGTAVSSFPTNGVWSGSFTNRGLSIPVGSSGSPSLTFTDNVGNLLSTAGIYANGNTVGIAGGLTLPRDPAAALEAVTKQYTDARVGVANVILSDTAPASPTNGELWYDTGNLHLMVYYNDGTSSQWVMI